MLRFFFLYIFCPSSSSSVFLSMASGGEGSSSPVISHTNRLAKERSPYLLQHAHNPVDWWVPLLYTFLKADVVHAKVLCIVGIHGDKRLLTKQGMKINRYFYQVRRALLTGVLCKVRNVFCKSAFLWIQWATRRVTGVMLWRGSLLKMKKLAKSWVTTLSASSWTEKRGLMWTRSTWPLFR